MNEEGYLLEEISKLTGVEMRTIYHWMSRGLLRGPGRQGPGTRYPKSFLHRVGFVQKLREHSVPLDMIAGTLESLPERVIEAVATGKEEVRLLLGTPSSARTAGELRMPRRVETLGESPRPDRSESDDVVEGLRALVWAARQRRTGASARWVTAQADEDVMLMVRGLDDKQVPDLDRQARRLGELLSRRPGRYVK